MDMPPPLSLDALRGRLKAALAARAPFSVIRLGDGEGRLMGYPEHVPDTLLADIWRTWFGHAAYRAPQVAELRAALVAACRTADVIGVPDAAPDLTSEFGRVAALLALEGTVAPGAALCQAGFHLWFERRGWYADLLAGLPEIGVIGPRDLTQVLPARFGIGRVHWLATPPEMRFSDLPEAEAAALTGADAHLAHRLPELLGREIPRLLDAHPGLVVLIGAGLPGKLYCARVKELGGVALDLGSMMDLWAGLKTRENPVFVDLRAPRGTAPLKTQPLSFDKASPAHRRSIEDALRRDGLDPERFCRPVPREDRAFFGALLPACGDDLSLALLRFTEAALREAGIVRRIAQGIFGQGIFGQGIFGGFDAPIEVLHADAGWGRLTRVLAQRLPPGRLTVSASRADAVAWQAETLGVATLPWPPTWSPPDAPRYDLILAGSLALPGEMPEEGLGIRLPVLHALLAPGGVLAVGQPGNPEGQDRAATVLRALPAAPGWRRHPGMLDGGRDLYLVGGPDRDAATLRLAAPT